MMTRLQGMARTVFELVCGSVRVRACWITTQITTLRELPSPLPLADIQLIGLAC